MTSVASLNLSERGLAVMVVCKSVNEAPDEPFVNESMKLLP
jgi:hypothetical protein